MPIQIYKRIPFYITGTQLINYYKYGNDSEKRVGTSSYFSEHFDQYKFRVEEMKVAFLKVYNDKKNYIKQNKVENESPYFFDIKDSEANSEFPEIISFYGYFWGNFNLLNSRNSQIDTKKFVLPYKENVLAVRDFKYIIKTGKVHIEIEAQKIKRIVGFLNFFYVDLDDYELICRHPESGHERVVYRKKRINHKSNFIGNGTFYPWYYKPCYFRQLSLSLHNSFYIII